LPVFRTSSPIDATEEDADVLEHFFNWKVGTTRNTDRKVKWDRARTIVFANDWSIDDLKRMEESASPMYERALKSGLSDGFARSFRTELRAFKSAIKALEALEAAQAAAREAEAAQALNISYPTS
jgi:hypothetical protein